MSEAPDLVDTHCHLDVEAFDADRSEVLARSRARGVRRLVIPAVDAAHWQPLLELCRREANLYPALGLHPVYVDRNLFEHLAPDNPPDYVIDAIDSIKFKAALIYHCRRNKIPVVTTGAAGGLTDPTRVLVKDLSRTFNDPLAGRVRAKLRAAYGYTRNPKRYFGVECVFSSQKQVYPRADGSVGCEKPGVHGVHLDCTLGYGSATFVTATMGFVAVARVIDKTLGKGESEARAPGPSATVVQPVAFPLR